MDSGRPGLPGAGTVDLGGTGAARKVPMNEHHKQEAVAGAADALGIRVGADREVLSRLWDAAFEQGRLAALDELQDRFCVCMK